MSYLNIRIIVNINVFNVLILKVLFNIIYTTHTHILYIYVRVRACGYIYTELTREDLNAGWSLGRFGRPVRHGKKKRKEKKIN